MLLKNRVAIIYGGGGSLGGAVARAFAREGAVVFITGRNESSLRKVVDDGKAAGSSIESAVVNALDPVQVTGHLKAVVQQTGHVDITFNAIGVEDKQGLALAEMSLEDFLRPVNNAMQTQFITTTVAARQMITQRSGVILSLTATPGIGYAMVGGFGPACAAIESFSRDLASELGIYGIRVVNIRSAGSPDSKPFLDAIAKDPERADAFLKKMKEDTMLKAMPAIADIANVAVFLASDMASSITGVIIDATAGTTTALNYKVTDIAFA